MKKRWKKPLRDDFGECEMWCFFFSSSQRRRVEKELAELGFKKISPAKARQVTPAMPHSTHAMGYFFLVTLAANYSGLATKVTAGIGGSALLGRLEPPAFWGRGGGLPESEVDEPPTNGDGVITV